MILRKRAFPHRIEQIFLILVNETMKLYPIFFFFLFTSFSWEMETKSDLTVSVTNIQHAKGKISFGLFRKQDSFPVKGKQFKGVLIDTKKPSTKYTFENLADGQYAVAIFHDENENGIMDKNMFGAPTEAYGFSRNARGTFSAPSFEEAKIDLKESKSIEIWIK
jgi:uncharacterized protein (DUF2141 family)